MLNFLFANPRMRVPERHEALPDRSEAIAVADRHAVLGTPMRGPWPGTESILFGMGCFWGAERLFWKQVGVTSTQVGYAGGSTVHATYRDVCSGRTGHTEVVRIQWDPTKTSLANMLQLFWENHDPTQGMRQGNDIGTQYRSAVYCSDEGQRGLVEASRVTYQAALDKAGWGTITTEIAGPQPFYFAEDHHQQYLHKNPDGYCGIGGTGVSCQVGLPTA